ITIPAQKILSCVLRMKERYGITMIIATLRGSRNSRILELGLDGLSTYGIMKDESKKSLRDKVNFLISREFLEQTDDSFPVVKTTPLSRGILFRGESLMMPVAVEKARPVVRRTTREPMPEMPIASDLFEKLRTLRKEIAAGQGVPAFMVFSDATLRDMCDRLPRTPEELLQVSGVGLVKQERYGKAFLELIVEHRLNTD
ncbi:MAG: DNA helicase RecQ, partial [Synergistaceae bacterium]|nr:DNA helicase RecQ [Synergistaceae bacterium]